MKMTAQKWRENGQTKELGEIIPILCVKLYDHVSKQHTVDLDNGNQWL